LISWSFEIPAYAYCKTCTPRETEAFIECGTVSQAEIFGIRPRSLKLYDD